MALCVIMSEIFIYFRIYDIKFGHKKYEIWVLYAVISLLQDPGIKTYFFILIITYSLKAVQSVIS